MTEIKTDIMINKDFWDSTVKSASEKLFKTTLTQRKFN